VCADDVRADESTGVLDRSVDVRLRSEIHDAVDPMLEHESRHECRVADVATDEAQAPVAGYRSEILEVAGVCQRIEDYDVGVPLPAQPMVNEVGADEPRAAGDQ
jgi:hypothetical protein